MIAHSTNRFHWPSIQRDSELLRRRIEAAQRIVRLRARLAEHFEGIGLLDGASSPTHRRSVEQAVPRSLPSHAAPSPAACSDSRRAA